MSWRHGVGGITAAQLHSVKPELRFGASSNPAHGVSEIRDGENLWQWSPLEIRLNANHTAKTIYHLHHYGFIEKSNGNNYLAFSSTVDNKKALEKYIKRWSKIKNPVSKINNNSGKKEIDFMKSNLIQITMYLLIEW